MPKTMRLSLLCLSFLEMELMGAEGPGGPPRSRADIRAHSPCRKCCDRIAGAEHDIDTYRQRSPEVARTNYEAAGRNKTPTAIRRATTEGARRCGSGHQCG